MQRLRSMLGLAALCSMLGTATPKAAEAQTVAQQGNAAAWTRYSAQKKDENTAFTQGLLIPTWGASYATGGDTHPGVAPLTTALTGLTLAFLGKLESPKCGGADESLACGRVHDPLIPIGALIFIGGEIWGGVRAHNIAVDFNTKLQQHLGLMPEPAH